MTKRKVYTDYEERFLSGNEIFELFKESYELFGRHHSKVSSYKIDFGKFFKRIKPDEVYRIFINGSFCKILNNTTDASIYFFGYTNSKPDWAKD